MTPKVGEVWRDKESRLDFEVLRVAHGYVSYRPMDATDGEDRIDAFLRDFERVEPTEPRS